MKSKLLKILNGILWLFVAFIAWFIVSSVLFGEGGDAYAAFATATALTAMIWMPVVAILAIIAAVMEYNVIRKNKLALTGLFKAPSIYIIAALLLVILLVLTQ